MHLRLFRPDDRHEIADLSLSAYFETVHVPRLTDPRKRRQLSPSSVLRRRAAISWWVRTTADPPIGLIDADCWDLLRARLREATFSRGGWRSRPLSAATICSTQREIAVVLREAFQAAGTVLDLEIDAMPARCGPKPCWSIEELRRIYRAIDGLQLVRLRGRPAPTWWSEATFRDLARATVGVWYYTGHRARTAWQLTPEQLIEYQPNVWMLDIHRSVKTGKPDRVAVHPHLLRLLLSVRSLDSRRLIPWPISYDTFAESHRRLLAAAAIGPARRWGPQAYRRAHAEQLTLGFFGAAQQVARGSLGHSDYALTAAWYVDVRKYLLPLLPPLEIINAPHEKTDGLRPAETAEARGL